MMLKHTPSKRKSLLVLLFFLSHLIVFPAYSSTTEAWASGDKVMATACRNASQLRDVKVIRVAAHFDDSVGYSVLLQEGVFSQKHMKSQHGREMCLYKRNSKKASVTVVDWK